MVGASSPSRVDAYVWLLTLPVLDFLPRFSVKRMSLGLRAVDLISSGSPSGDV
jgi:hypothetical protein